MCEKYKPKYLIGRSLAAVVLFMFLIVTGCTPSAPAPAQSQPAVQPETKVAAESIKPTDTQALPTSTAAEVKVADTAVPTETTAPTQAPTATATTASSNVDSAQATSTPAAAAAGGTPVPDKSFNAWCLPLDASVSNASEPLKPPANAKLASLTTDALVLRNLPSNGCVFIYAFPQTASTDLQLEVSEKDGAAPFYKVKLEPVSGRSDVLYALVRHAMIIAPPVKTVTYTFVLRDPLGQVLRKDQVKLYGSVPAASGGSASGNEGEGEGGGEEDCGCTVPLP